MIFTVAISQMRPAHLHRTCQTLLTFAELLDLTKLCLELDGLVIFTCIKQKAALKGSARCLDAQGLKWD